MTGGHSRTVTTHPYKLKYCQRTKFMHVKPFFVSLVAFCDSECDLFPRNIIFYLFFVFFLLLFNFIVIVMEINWVNSKICNQRQQQQQSNIGGHQRKIRARVRNFFSFISFTTHRQLSLAINFNAKELILIRNWVARQNKYIYVHYAPISSETFLFVFFFILKPNGLLRAVITIK